MLLKNLLEGLERLLHYRLRWEIQHNVTRRASRRRNCYHWRLNRNRRLPVAKLSNCWRTARLLCCLRLRHNSSHRGGQDSACCGAKHSLCDVLRRLSRLRH